VLKAALGGGSGDIPGADAGSLAATATQFIDDMEEQVVVPDRRCAAGAACRVLGLGPACAAAE
jgi:hypothetical protein